jgi:FlaA1/EpsC-like NDP-sugar epimerase
MTALITGITGTLGTIVAERLLEDGSTVRGFSRDECKQAKIPRHERLTLYLGDVRDRDRLVEAARGVGLIYHFAALKHVDQLEANPEEAVQTNILGTENVLHAQRMLGIPRIVLTSTDKAAYPVNAYGMSKGIAERLVLRNPNNVVCRYGNVLASRGSVVEAFVRSLRDEKAVSVTDSQMTRFWITQEDAASFVLSAAAGGGGLKIPTMKMASVTQIAAAVASCMNIHSYQTRHVGVRPGEKLSECLRTEHEGEEVYSHRAARFTDDELFQLLKPIVRRLM